MENKSWSFKQIILLGITAISIYLILFTKWLGIDLFYSTFSISLLKIGKYASVLTDYLDSGPVTVIELLIYGLLVVGAVMFLVTVSNIVSAHVTGDDISKAGFVFAILLPGLILIVTLIINAVISSETDGYVDSLLTVEAPAYVTMALGIVGCLVCNKMDVNDAAPSSTANHESPSSNFSKTPTLFCPNCGKTSKKDDTMFCSYCGTQLVLELRCPNCLELLEPDMKFCPYCGADVHNN